MACGVHASDADAAGHVGLTYTSSLWIHRVNHVLAFKQNFCKRLGSPPYLNAPFSARISV